MIHPWTEQGILLLNREHHSCQNQSFWLILSLLGRLVNPSQHLMYSVRPTALAHGILQWRLEGAFGALIIY